VHGSVLVGKRDREVAPLVEFLALRRRGLLEDRDGLCTRAEAEGRLLGALVSNGLCVMKRGSDRPLCEQQTKIRIIPIPMSHAGFSGSAKR
jgi:hypothetical protein